MIQNIFRAGVLTRLTALVGLAVLIALGVTPSEAQSQGSGPVGPPRDVEVAQGISSVEVGWSEPGGNGQSPTGYRVRWRDSDDPEDSWQPSADGVTLPTAARSHRITGLERSHYPRGGQGGIGYYPLVRKSYVIEVAADTPSGSGEWVSVDSGELQGTVAPDAPLDLGVSRDGQLVVTWEVPANAGERVRSPFDSRETNPPPDPKVESFYLRWREAGAGGQAGPWQRANGDSDLGHLVDRCTERVSEYIGGRAVIERTCTTDYTITSLDSSMAYEVQVRTLNDIGVVSAWAESPLMMILAGGEGGDVVPEADGDAQVEAKLNKPAPAGGVRVTLRTRSNDPGTARPDVDYSLPGPFTIAEGGMTGSAVIEIHDDAVNERDETINLTAAVDVADIAVTGMTVTIEDDEDSPQLSERYTASLFYTPGGLWVTPGDGSITATFNPASRAGITYWLQWRTDDNPEWTTVQSVTSPHTLEGLVNGVKHHLRVAGIDFNHGLGPPWASAWVNAASTPAVLGAVPQSSNELGLSVDATEDAVRENAGSVKARATLHSPAPAGGVTVRLVLAAGDSGTAAPGADYFLPDSFVIPEGKQEATADITIVDNAVNEADKTMGITAITDLASIESVTPDPLVITIRDDEPDYVDPPERSRRWLRDEWKVRNLEVRPGDGELTVDFDPPAATSRNRRVYWLQWRAYDNPLWTTLIGAQPGHVITGLDNGVAHHVRVTNLQLASVGTPSAWGGWIEGGATPNEPNTLMLSASRRTAAEGGTAVTLTAVAVLDSSTSGGNVEINLTPDPGSTASEGDDYLLPTDFFIPAGGYTVTGELTILDDSIDEDDETIVLNVSTNPALSITGGPITIAITDNDTAGVTIAAEPPLAVYETEGAEHAASYTVVLDSKPTAAVTVTPTSGDPTAAVAGPALTFGPDDWDVPQTVTVSGVDDDDKTHETLTITHDVTSNDAKYDGITPSIPSIAVELTDDDLPTLTFEYGYQTVTETDAEFRHSPRLWIRNASPGDNSISVSMGLDTTGRGTATWSAGACGSGADFVFPSAFGGFSLDFHGSSAFVTVTGLRICGDDAAETDETLILYLAPRPDQYNIVANRELFITIRDDDAGGL